MSGKNNISITQEKKRTSRRGWCSLGTILFRCLVLRRSPCMMGRGWLVGLERGVDGKGLRAL